MDRKQECFSTAGVFVLLKCSSFSDILATPLMGNDLLLFVLIEFLSRPYQSLLFSNFKVPLPDYKYVKRLGGAFDRKYHPGLFTPHV